MFVRPGFHSVVLALRRSFRVVYGRWLLSYFGLLSCFHLVVYGLFGSLLLKPNFLILAPEFRKPMGLKLPYKVIAVFPYHFLGRLRSFGVFQIEMISIPTTQSFLVEDPGGNS